jgi:hypothetical protein
VIIFSVIAITAPFPNIPGHIQQTICRFSLWERSWRSSEFKSIVIMIYRVIVRFMKR